MCLRQRLRGLLAGDRLFEHAHDVALLHDEVIDAVDLDLGPGPFSKQHDLASLQIDGNQFAVLVAAPRTDGDDLALGGFLLRRIRNDDAACALFFGVDALDYNPIMKRTKLHIVLQIRLRWFSGRTKARGEAAHCGRQRCPERPMMYSQSWHSSMETANDARSDRSRPESCVKTPTCKKSELAALAQPKDDFIQRYNPTTRCCRSQQVWPRQ